MDNQIKQNRNTALNNETAQETEINNGKHPEITPERIQKVKKAFKSTWLEEQLAGEDKTPEKPSEKSRKSS